MKESSSLKAQEPEEQKTRNELFRKYSDKIDEMEKINKSRSFIMKSLLEFYLGKDGFFNLAKFSFFREHDKICESLLLKLERSQKQEDGGQWIIDLGEYLNKNLVNKNGDFCALLSAFFQRYPNTCPSTFNFERYPKINSIIKISNETYRYVMPLTTYIISLLEHLMPRLDLKTISRLSCTCTFFKKPFKDAMRRDELLHWTVRGHLKKVEEILKKNPELAEKPGTVTALSDKLFDGFTGYQISIFEHDQDIKAVYEKYLSKEQVKVQKNFLKENFARHSQLRLYFDITPLELKMDHYRTNYHNWSHTKCEQKWQNEIGGDYKKFPAWLVYAMCEEGCNVAWTENNLENMKVERQYAKGHLEWWFSKEGRKLGDTWAPARGQDYRPREYDVAGSICYGSVSPAGFMTVHDIVEVYTWAHDIKVIQSVKAICLEALNGPKANLGYSKQ